MTPTIDAAAVWPSGRMQLGRAKAARVQGAADAIASLRAGAVVVYVAREDVEQVRAWVNHARPSVALPVSPSEVARDAHE